MSKLIKISNILLFSILSLTLYSQTESYGTWTSIGIDKKLKKWDFSAETELRTIYYIRLIDRWSLGVNADYNIFKQLKVGIGFQFMNSLDYDVDYQKSYFFRNRFNVSTTGKIKLNDFSFSLRERIQLTQKEDRFQLDGSIDSYKMNPALDWRNRFQISYNIPHSKITPSASIETFYVINNPEGNSFDNIRYILSFDYKINKKNHFEIYGLVNSELESDDSTGKFILGLSYNFSL